MTASQLARLGRTAIHLRPSQAAHRLRLRSQRAVLERWPQVARPLLAGPDPASAIGWPPGFVPLDGRTPARWPGRAELQWGRFQLLGVTRDLGTSPDWRKAEAPQLWQFHLHYWDWAWGLTADQDRAAAQALFARLWASWRDAIAVGREPAWRPYPAALRAWSFCGLHRDLVAGSEIEDSFTADLAVHAGYLRRHLELDVGGNHLIKNLKGLAGLAVFFADDRLLEGALSRLVAQLAVQILPDGGHYERAPAYHCQVLSDLLDLAGLLRVASKAPPRALDVAISAMQSWLEVVISPTGEVPLLNDGYPIDPELLAILRQEPKAVGKLQVLPETGLVKATVGGWDLLADVGPPCPAELPAHAHADTFGCLVHVDGIPLLVDTGTSAYAAGPVRSYERSTAAHSTVEIDGTDSTEVWGVFRAGRRARVRDLAIRSWPGAVTIEAAHDGYRALPGRPVHCRNWWLTEDGLRIRDDVRGRGRHLVVVRWHFAPRADLYLSQGGALVVTDAGAFEVSVSADALLTLTADRWPVATGFERTADASVLAVRIDCFLPVRICTSWRRGSAHRLATSTASVLRPGEAASVVTVGIAEGAR